MHHSKKLRQFIAYIKSWHRIISMSSPWVAVQDTADRQIAAFERAVFRYSLYSVLAAGRRIAAVAAQMWGYKQLISPYEEDKKTYK
jgi:hypothetical protein